LGYVNWLPREKEKFETLMSEKIKSFEKIIETQPERADEYSNIIWGMHRVLAFLDVDIVEDNDIL